MKRNIFILFFLLFTYFVYPKPVFKLDKPYWDFGKVNAGEKIVQILTLKNFGDEPLEVRLRSSCECIHLDKNEVVINPQQQEKIKIVFDTKGYSGRLTHYLFIDTNDPEVKHLKWIIEGTVIPTKNIFKKKQQEVKNIEDVYVATITVKMFYTAGCNTCEKIKKKIIPLVEQKTKIRILVEEYRLEIPENYEMLLSIEEHLGIKKTKIPIIVVGNTLLAGVKEIEQKLATEVEKNCYENKKLLDFKTNGQVVNKHIENLILPTVLMSGLVDGVNPCAIATIVFLIAYLSMVRKKSIRDIFFVGMFFIFGVFVAYILIGLTLAKVLLYVEIKSVVGKILYFLIAILTFVFAVISFSDVYAIYRLEKGEQAKVYLQLPWSFRMKIYNIVEKFTGSGFILPSSFLIGFIVSVIEFFCTGQIYLPTIMYMIATEHFRTKGIIYLILYCIMFVFPLIIIFVLLFFGLKSEKLEYFVSKHMKTTKFFTGIVFLALTILILFVILL